MPNPFLGMDPYLEAHWGDVHQSLITYARDQLQAQLPADLRARVQERMFVEMPEGVHRPVYPDVRVIERPIRGRQSAAGGVAVAEIAEPVGIAIIAAEHRRDRIAPKVGLVAVAKQLTQSLGRRLRLGLRAGCGRRSLSQSGARARQQQGGKKGTGGK